ncbi:hypothetical protein FDG2_2710 [Candidatus Protofrankia californiensis]|uniref:DUF3000 domain-containing protein n=1 Tax=Candidatus Protofrankia californiensis TaxID=1839754 RepID=A0A1C3NY61_9ACTN|nr:hypothetical protein FDG2_2710 [Candidatus Protofrankia californiensis]
MTSMGASLSPDGVPSVFVAATAALRDALGRVRSEVAVHELQAPTKLAPYAFAVAGGLSRDGDEAASGRLILLFDPAGHSAWEGTARFVCYARAAVDPEIAADPLLPEVVWSWLHDALEANQVGYRAMGGTVTITNSKRFGVLAADGDNSDVELRCSWSPDWAETTAGCSHRAWRPTEAVAHLHSFADLLAAMAGLPPRVCGVVPLPSRRG